MTNIVDTTERDALALLLRSKTALGRLVEAEVHSVLDFLESIGFVHQVPQPVVVPAPLAPPPAQ